MALIWFMISKARNLYILLHLFKKQFTNVFFAFHWSEILLCASSGSKTVLNFLLRACQKRKFTVLVAENYPNDTKEAHNFAKSLAKAGIETVVIPDATVFAVMSRVGKVILGARTGK